MNVHFEEGLVCFLNLYMIPFVSLWLHFRLQNRSANLTKECVFLYAMYSISTYVLTHFGAVIIRKIIGMEIVITGSKYTILAVIVAVAISFCEKIIRDYFSFAKNQQNLDSEKDSEKTGEQK